MRTVKSGTVLGSLVKVATLPLGRKSIVPDPSLSLGIQLIVAFVLPTVMVSVVGEVIVRVAAPSTAMFGLGSVGVPWKAWARAFCAVVPAVTTIAAAAQDHSNLRLVVRTGRGAEATRMG